MTDIAALYDARQGFGEHFQTCIACGSPAISPWREKRFAASARSDIQTFSIFRCADCGSGFLNPPPSAEFLREVYAVSGHGLTRGA